MRKIIILFVMMILTVSTVLSIYVEEINSKDEYRAVLKGVLRDFLSSPDDGDYTKNEIVDLLSFYKKEKDFSKNKLLERGAKTKEKISSLLKKKTIFSKCGKDEPIICGVNNVEYDNRCHAEFKGVAVNCTGECPCSS